MLYILKKQTNFILLNCFFCNGYCLAFLLYMCIYIYIYIYSCNKTCESQIKNTYYNEAANLYDVIKNIILFIVFVANRLEMLMHEVTLTLLSFMVVLPFVLTLVVQLPGCLLFWLSLLLLLLSLLQPVTMFATEITMMATHTAITVTNKQTHETI